MGAAKLSHQADEPGSEQGLGSRVVLFTDIVGSLRLKQILGDRKAVALIQQHHGLVRETLRQCQVGEEIETAGDSFLILFANPADAIRFALFLQARLRAFSDEHHRSILDRVGLHRGEIYIRQQEGTPKVFGIHVDISARVMSLAEGGQILMTRAVFDAARPVLRPEEFGAATELAWLNHGPYLLKGLDEVVEICEVGEKGLSLGKAPGASALAERQAVAETDNFFGWRPAVKQHVPNAEWVLLEKLGEGGFGEVWLSTRGVEGERRVLKFCFRFDRVRALKREVTLFHLLAQRSGEHPHIVRLIDVCFDRPPVYLVEEYLGGKDLKTWCGIKGGPASIPVETRIEIIAQAADGLQGAHDAGIIHRDIKPGNILISSQDDLLVKLSDFGIGQLISDEALQGVTEAGFTATVLPAGSGQSGTQLYMAPELYLGQPASIRSDIYSLGVVLYQLLIGDFSSPLTPDWAERIPDSLLREDLRRCFASNPSDRFEGAGQLTRNLRALRQRRAALADQEALAAARERAAYRRGLLRSASIALIIVAVIASLALIAWHQGQQSRERLIRLNLATGIRMWETGDLLGSLPWLVEALSLDRDRTRIETGRIRIGAVLRQAPKLVQVWTHGDMVTAGDLTQDGRIVTASRDGTVQVWNGSTGKPAIPVLRLGRPVLSVAFASNGSRFVTTTDDGAAQLWNPQTGALQGQEITHHSAHERDQSIAAAFSPDSKRLVTCGTDKQARVFDTRDRRELMPPVQHESPLSYVAISPSSDRFIVCGDDGEAWIHDLRSGAVLAAPLKHRASVIYASFSPDGTRVVTCCQDGIAQIWDSSSGQAIGVPLRHERAVLTGEFSPDSRWVVTASYDRTARLWDAATGLPRSSPLRHTHSVVQATFSPDGRFVLTSSHDHTARLWNASDGAEVLQLKHNGFVLFSKFASNGHQILTTSQDHMAKLWDIAGTLADCPIIHHSAQPITCVTFSPDAKLIASASVDHSAAVWDPATGALVTKVQHQAQVNAIAFSPDSRRFVTGSNDKTARLWEVPSGRQIGPPLEHGGSVVCVCFAPSGKILLTGSKDGFARLWDTTTARLLTPPLQHRGPIRWVAFSPDGTKVATASEDHSARIWDSETGKPLSPPLVHDVELRHLAFSPDSRKLATACADLFDPFLFPARAGQIWDVMSGQRFGPPLQHGDGVLWCEFSPNGRLVVTTSEDGTARLWKADSGKPALPPLKHNWHVLQAEFSADGNELLTAARDSTARLWDVHSGDPVIPVLRHTAERVCAALAPDGRHVVTATDAGNLYVWALDRDRRDVADLRRLSEVLTGQTFDPFLGPTALSPEAFLEKWKALREKSPGDLTVSPRSIAIWHGLQAELCARQQMWTGVWVHLSQLISIEPENPQHLLDRAEFSLAQGHWEEAVDDLSKATQLRPRDLEAAESLARALAQLHKPGEAIAAYAKAIALMDPDDPQLRLRRRTAFGARAALLKQEHRFAEAVVDQLHSLGVPLREPCAGPAQIDLSPFYNYSFADNLHGIEGNNLITLPTGCQTLAGVKFDLRGIVQVANQGLLEKTCPERRVGIPIGQTCHAIHFLQGAAWGGSVGPGTTIGRYVVHFADGSEQTIPIRYGQDVLDWWQPTGHAAAPTEAALAWSGQNTASGISLFESTWHDPSPELPITAIDFISNMTPAAPFLVALSLE